MELLQTDIKKLRSIRIMEKKEVFVDISARHVHLTREDQDVLFGKGYELEVYKELAGGGGFASVEQIAIVGPKSTFPKVRILGPCSRAHGSGVQKDARMGDRKHAENGSR